MTRFSEHGLVDLVLDTGERRAAQVSAVSRRQILLTLLPGSSDPSVGPDFVGASLQGIGPQGVSRIVGAVACVPSPSDQAVVAFKPAAPTGMRERRAAPRLALDRDVIITRVQSDGGSAVGRVLDISAGGMRLHSAASFTVGERLWVAFEARSPTSEARTEGRVVRVGEKGELALVVADGPAARRSRADRLIRSARVHG